jgi:CelD/BcsL family acetyltransferase involved in cellulose biosynthesis
MQNYIWVHACAEAFTNGKVRIVTAGAPNPHALAALCQPQDSAALVPLGAELYEPMEFAYADIAAAGDLAEAIARLDKPLFINDIFQESPFVESLRRAGGRRLVVRPRSGHPWVELDDSWLEPESHLNAGRRSDLRRARRHAEKLGPVHFEMTVPDAQSLEPVLAEAFRVEAANWKGRQGSALAMDPQVGKFYRCFARAACARGMLRMGLLRFGERAVAMQFAIQQGTCFWLFKMGFDEEFARCSPGMLLMVESFRYARQQGCCRYELMGKSEAWNQVWTQHTHPAVSLHLHGSGMKGWIAVGADLVRAAIGSRLHRTKEQTR